MRLKRMEAYGFKSFANRTVLDFSDGLTVIVGPNGCGKSNVADCIQWIFGEMSAKTLRGSGMTDVIFSGSRNRRAYSYAEGTLTFSNEDREINMPFDEITITRTISRTGESEYQINGERCRLTDVKIMLQGTGLGTSDYSVIQQGAVESLISSDSQSRRGVFDEAAGISKYKYRRDRAARKLEKVDIALDRLKDRIEDTDRELKSLRRRASAAQRYQVITTEWRGKDLLLSNLRFGAVQEELTARRAEHGAIENVLAENSGLESRFSADVARMEDSVFALDKKVNDTERGKIGVENEISQNENNIEWLRESIAERRALREEKDAENREIGGRLETRAAETDVLQKEITAIDDEVKNKEQALARDEARLEEVRAEFSRIMEILEGKKRSLEETYGQSSVTKNDIDTLKAERNAGQSSQLEMETRHEKLKIDQNRLEVQTTRLNDVIGTLDAQRETASRRLDALIDSKDKLSGRRESMQRDISDIRHSLTRTESRLHLLLDLENKYEGLSAGVKGILQELKSDGTALKGVYGMVADFIRVEIADEAVIELALGDNVQNIIVDSAANALEAIRHLETRDLGRATFMPEDTAHNGRELDPALLAAPGVEGAASGLVRHRDEHAGILKHLLGKTVILKDIEAYRALDPALAADVTVVTRDGYVIERNGMISGGSSRQLGGIISRKNEIERLRAAYENDRARLAAREEELDGLSGEVATVLADIEQVTREIKTTDAAAGENRKQLLRDERDLIHVNETISSVVGTIVATGVRLEEIEEALVAEEGTHNWFGRLAELLTREMRALETRAGELARDRDTLQKGIAELKISLATTSGNKEIIAEKISHVLQNVTELKLEQEKNDQLAAKAEREIAQNEERIREKEEAIRVLGAALAQAEKDLVEHRNAAETVRAEYDVQKSRYKSILAENRKQHDLLKDVELQVNNLEHEGQRIEEHVLQNHGVSIVEEHGRFEMPAEPVDQAALDIEVKNLFSTRSKITGADPTAIERLESVSLRAEYLTLQRDDLQSARDALRTLITRINKESSRRFTETFEIIRENFKTLFRKLFGGGRADLILEPDKDVLEAGVDIVVRPPGSQLQSISLLSGGQKAMVVMCLLFSVLKSKPSPLCLLDEIDGPLDEANVDRFMALVNEFMERSQFIIISHNKKTVSKADLIYGITMEEPGISKKLSLRFEDIRKDERLLGKPTAAEQTAAGA